MKLLSILKVCVKLFLSTCYAILLLPAIQCFCLLTFYRNLIVGCALRRYIRLLCGLFHSLFSSFPLRTGSKYRTCSVLCVGCVRLYVRGRSAFSPRHNHTHTQAEHRAERPEGKKGTVCFCFCCFLSVPLFLPYFTLPGSSQPQSAVLLLFYGHAIHIHRRDVGNRRKKEEKQLQCACVCVRAHKYDAFYLSVTVFHSRRPLSVVSVDPSKQTFFYVPGSQKKSSLGCDGEFILA